MNPCLSRPVLNNRNEVFSIKSVSVVPLIEDLARPLIEVMASKADKKSKVPLRGLSPIDRAETLSEASEREPQDQRRTEQAKVTFAEKDDVKIMSPLPEQTFFGRSSSPVPSTASSVSSEASMRASDADEPQTLPKMIASRLSFWSGQPKNTTDFPGEEDRLIDTDQESSAGASQELSDGLGGLGISTPSTLKQRQNELDAKILKECLKEFTKGGMYFSYNFGEIILCSLLQVDVLAANVFLQRRSHNITSTQTQRNCKGKAS